MKPILFNTEMVRAIQYCTKMVTRRIAKPQPPKDVTGTYWRMDNGNFQLKIAPYEYIYDYEIKPRYQVGDILYVRETWFYEEHMQDITAGEPDLPSGRYSFRYVYKAEYPDYPVNVGVGADGWRPSIHMPKEAARIFLRVTDVRVERLQDMTVDDCLKEGVTASPPPICRGEISFPKGFEHLTEEKQKNWIESAARARYIGWCDFADKLFRAMTLVWNSTIKESDLDKYGWSANPWVFVTSFQAISKQEAYNNGGC